MINHPSFPVDDWHLRETHLDTGSLASAETLFSLSNGYLGLRGNLDESAPAVEPGTYVNGFYETREIEYGERAYGYPDDGQTMLNVTDGKVIDLSVDGEPLDVRTGRVDDHDRVVDFRAPPWAGPCDGPRQPAVSSRCGRRDWCRSNTGTSPPSSTRWRSSTSPPSWSSPRTWSRTRAARPTPATPASPRPSTVRCSCPAFSHGTERRIVLGHVTRASRLKIVSGIDHRVDTEAEYTSEQSHSDDRGSVAFTVRAEPGKPFRMVKYLTYHTSDTESTDKLHSQAHKLLDRSVDDDFADLVAGQRSYVDEFWDTADIVVEGDAAVQQAVRFSQFQILQASARADHHGIPAKGLTGQGYEGHYFWDMETFVLAMLTYTQPETVKGVLLYRHSTLDKARDRAKVMSQRGALFPWRTINGNEVSPYFPAGTAQYHIDADIMAALRRYVDATDDREFLEDYGAEMLVETARLYRSLGYFADRYDGAFCIDEVTGPDEYSALVDNNLFTNLMARANLHDAAETMDRLREEHGSVHDRVCALTDLDQSEVDDWRRAADRMYLHYDERLGIHGQDDRFLDKPHWDFAGTPPENYPLLLHYHPLVIYRHQVSKQADLVLGLFLQGDDISREQKRADFDYYDPITTGDSSLSACVQAVVAAEVGHLEPAYEYARRTALMDLNDVNHNVADGIHIAAMAGTWVALVHGFGGMRHRGDRLRFEPQLPSEWDRLRFSLRFRGKILDVDIGPDETSYAVRDGRTLDVEHWGGTLTVGADGPATAPTGATPGD
ncbi:MAG: glycosyl hydrolase family 65 protein [Acidimicrobiia bacterium]|nr:glycosyl hydrolase family 65 protein [Acidimicrobiia bacterium]